MDLKKTISIIEGLAAEAAQELGMELVDVELKTSRGGYHIVVYIDKPGGVFIEDCEQVSKSLGVLMDQHDPVPTSYVLEVSSPGEERPLKKKEDYVKFKGENVKIKTAKQIDGSKNFTGILQEVREEGLMLEVGREIIEILFEDISKANLCSKKGVGKR